MRFALLLCVGLVVLFLACAAASVLAVIAYGGTL
jgi:hypothetical protein